MITSHPGITWLVVNKQRIKIGFMWSSLLNNLTISLSLFMLQLPIAVTHRLQYQKLAFIAFLENNVKNCVGDIVYDLDQQKANHKTSSVADSLSGCGGQKTWDIFPLAFSIEPPSDCVGEEEHMKIFLSQ